MRPEYIVVFIDRLNVITIWLCLEWENVTSLQGFYHKDCLSSAFKKFIRRQDTLFVSKTFHASTPFFEMCIRQYQHPGELLSLFNALCKRTPNINSDHLESCLFKHWRDWRLTKFVLAYFFLKKVTNYSQTSA